MATRDRKEMLGKIEHVLTVFSAVDIPDDVANKVSALLSSYDVDIYTRACDAHGYTSTYRQAMEESLAGGDY